jgi:hypothetical protein
MGLTAGENETANSIYRSLVGPSMERTFAPVVRGRVEGEG